MLGKTVDRTLGQREPDEASDVPRSSRESAKASDEERKLIEQAQAGDRQAFEQLVYRYDKRILRLALYVVRDRDLAHDVYQDTFLKAYRSIKRFRFEPSFGTWIYRIARNSCIDHLRKVHRSRREVPIESDTESDAGSPSLSEFLRSTSLDGDPERRLYGAEIAAAVETALQTLTGKERLVFELRHYHGLRLKTVGEAMGITEGRAKTYLYRGTAKLRLALAGFRVVRADPKTAEDE